MAKPPNKVLLAGAGAFIVLAILAVGAFTVGPFGGGGHNQPIAFPHDVHAGTNQIPCMYCHTTADRSVDAGIPSVQTCAGCHIPGGAPLIAADNPEVQKLIAYWREQRPIPWERIYKSPDHVRFPHMRHVNADIQCQECHGPVETMGVLTSVYDGRSPQSSFAGTIRPRTMQMGWCINCHQERGARIDCFVCHY
jgi:hypothetical protein